MNDRLRKIVMLMVDYERLLNESGGGLVQLACLIGRRSGVPDLKFIALRLDGIHVQLFVHSATFDIEKCQCRAPLWAPAGIGV